MSAMQLFRVFLCLALFVAGLQVVAGDAPKPGKPYSLSLKVQRTAKPGAFEFSATVTDTKTNKVVFEPQMALKAGEPVKASTLDSKWTEYTLEVTVDKAGKEATYTFLVKSDDKEVQKDEGKVAVQP